MNEITLSLVLHNHQPVGNFPWAFRESYEKAYLPLLDALERHPAIRLGLHYSGPLIDWLEANEPQFLDRVAVLAARGQVEMLTSGYYEPVLVAIPEADQLGQIAKMNAYIATRFGMIPDGLWLTERVWEPHLPHTLAASGIRWTLVDDSHFQMVGIDEPDINGYFLTEEEGHLVAIFVTSQPLRYRIPWSPVEEVIDYLRGRAIDGEPRLVVMGDDGEKFGAWPNTYEHCWTGGWMERFFEALERNAEWLHLATPGAYQREHAPQGRVYLPCASYIEMMEWALPAPRGRTYADVRHQAEQEGRQDLLGFLRGGYWRSFMVKYPEINAMHKKMLYVHRKVHETVAAGADAAALDELWAGQCNCPYWHGVFGGVYLTDIRSATYHHLIRAEDAADRWRHPRQGWCDLVRTDFDYDGRDEILVETARQNLYLAPEDGGTIFEWDLRRSAYNLVSTLARREEAYHRRFQEIQQQEAASQGDVTSIHGDLRVTESARHAGIVYDRYLRSGLRDHFFPRETAFSTFILDSSGDAGAAFAGQPYVLQHRQRADKIELVLQRSGEVPTEGRTTTIHLAKTLTIPTDDTRLDATYELTNRGEYPYVGRFAVEWNFNLLGGGGNPVAFWTAPGQPDEYRLDQAGEVNQANAFTLGNRGLGLELKLRLDRRATLWYFPVETVSSSEAGLERTYQGSCLTAVWDLDLAPGTSIRLSLAWDIQERVSAG